MSSFSCVDPEGDWISDQRDIWRARMRNALEIAKRNGLELEARIERALEALEDGELELVSAILQELLLELAAEDGAGERWPGEREPADSV